MISYLKIHKNIKLKSKKNNNNFLFKKKNLIFSKTINFLSEKEIEASRRIITRSLNRVCKVNIFISKKFIITRKSLNMRMGKGRGKFFKNLHPIYWGSKIISVSSSNHLLLDSAIIKASKKLSCIKKSYCNYD